MNDERFVEEIVTEFLLSTCRLRPPLTEHVLVALIECVKAPADQPNGTVARRIRLKTGSVAEFYIEPMLPHIGDVDMQYHHSTELAIPRGQSPPTQLPAEFHSCVKVAEMIDSHLPGYVYLELRYILKECVDDGEYNAEECDRNIYAVDCRTPGEGYVIHGPAHTYCVMQLSLDCVPCIRCLSWPPQATDWPTRHRNYRWPDSETVDRIVKNGCDVVRIAHHHYRHHELFGKRQWRLSFSRAEIVLLNNWMPIQQIVYHMLRVFMKAEQLSADADNSGAGKLRTII